MIVNWYRLFDCSTCLRQYNGIIKTDGLTDLLTVNDCGFCIDSSVLTIISEQQNPNMLLMSAQIACVPPKSKTPKKLGGSLDPIPKAFMPMHRKYQG